MSQRSEAASIPDILPLIPLRDLSLFPNLVVPLFVGRERSIKALEEAMREGHLVALATQRKAETQDPGAEDIYEIGCVATVMQELKLPDGTAKALVEGQQRFRILEYLQTDPFFVVRVELIDEPQEVDVETEALMRALVGDFEHAAELGRPIPHEVLVAASSIEEPGRLADFIAFHLSLRVDDKQEILEALEPRDRLEKATRFLKKELEILELGTKIQDRVKEQMTKTQREYFLREQLKAIQQELGQFDEVQAEVEEYTDKIREAGMPEEVQEKALKELGRFQKMPPAGAETSVIRTYLDWLVGLPWATESEEKLDLAEAQLILDEDHYGLEKVKERILEYLAVHKLTDAMHGPILCFVGPPGVGKTSIGRSISRALGRQFIRMSLGGVRDEAEIRGHRRTYVGALPGRIIQSINQVGTKNPVFMMDEIDKVGADFRGDPTSALLEVLDPEQNNSFQDHYLEAPFDLSNVMFITTANLLDTIPPALRDRMEVIHFPGYTEEEKIHIAEKYLIPKQLAEHGLSSAKLEIKAEAVRDMVRVYTREAGVRGLERTVATIARQVARKVVEGKKGKTVVSHRTLHKYLGPEKFSFGIAGEKDEVGVSTGLVWTRGRRRRHLDRGNADAGQGRADPDRPARRCHAGVGHGGRLLHPRPRDPARHPGGLPGAHRPAHPRAGGGDAQGRPVGGHHDGDGHRLGAHRLPREARHRHDRRDHAARERAADRRAQGQAARRPSGRPGDGAHPQGQCARPEPASRARSDRAQHRAGQEHGRGARARAGGLVPAQAGAPQSRHLRGPADPTVARARRAD